MDKICFMVLSFQFRLPFGFMLLTYLTIFFTTKLFIQIEKISKLNTLDFVSTVTNTFFRNKTINSYPLVKKLALDLHVDFYMFLCLCVYMYFRSFFQDPLVVIFGFFRCCMRLARLIFYFKSPSFGWALRGLDDVLEESNTTFLM